MLINIDNGKLELISELNNLVDKHLGTDSDKAIQAHDQLRNVCTTELLAQIKMLDEANRRS